MNLRVVGSLHDRRGEVGSDSSSDPIERTVLGGGPVRDRGRSAGSGGRMAEARAGGRRRGPPNGELPSAGSIRTFLLIESATFLSAAALHFGALFSGFAHGAAAAAESVIASVLLGGLLATWIGPRTVRGIALTVQGFALIGTFVGLFTIAIGIGPRTGPDLVIHAIMVIELVWGLVVAARARFDSTGASS